MTGGASSRAKGARWQTEVRKWLDECADGEVRARSAGEPGDDLAATVLGVQLSVECKNARALDLAGWIDQASDNAAADEVPVVIFHRRGRTSVGDGYALTTPDWLAVMLAHAYEAGMRHGRAMR